MRTQVGPAFTQMQTFDVPSGAPIEWSEYYGAFRGDPAVLLGDDYDAALAAVAAWRAGGASGVNDSTIADADAFLAGLAYTPVDEVLSPGSPWGAVELARRAAPGGGGGTLPFPPGVTFDVSGSASAAEAVPWLELLSPAGTFSPATLDAEPTSFQVRRRASAWRAPVRMLAPCSAARLVVSIWLRAPRWLRRVCPALLLFPLILSTRLGVVHVRTP